MNVEFLAQNERSISHFPHHKAQETSWRKRRKLHKSQNLGKSDMKYLSVMTLQSQYTYKLIENILKHRKHGEQSKL